MKACAPESIRATTAILRHFRAFIRSDCTRMIDPYSGWHRIELNREQAQRKQPGSWMLPSIAAPEYLISFLRPNCCATPGGWLTSASTGHACINSRPLFAPSGSHTCFLPIPMNDIAAAPDR